MPSREENPCAEALREIYQQAHGDLRGYERHLAAEQEKGSALRRERLLTERIPQPERPPAFRLKGLAGDFVSSDDLVGKVAVVNFWGVWCSGCRQEMPYFQRLVDKYRHDPAVVVLSIDTYDALPILQKWIREKAYTFPVLLDDGLVYDARVESFPTTWFLDRRGRIAYIQIGSDQNLVEEFGWRIEDLKHR